MRRIVAAGLMAALALTACGGGSPTVDESPGSIANDRSYDVSGIQKVDAIALLVPEDIAASGKLVIAEAPDYAPAEFRADDLQTPIGYDVDLGKALGKVLGLEAVVQPGEFASLLPSIGVTTDIGISSFTITPERAANFNMVSYIEVGSSFAVQAGNPENFDPNNICGQAIGVQTGTYQEEELATLSEKCGAEGNAAVEILSYGVQSDVTTNLIGGKVVAFYADSTVADYSVALTNDQLEVVGGVRDAAPQGIVVSKSDERLTEAIQEAMQHLINEGTWEAILASWGVSEGAALMTAEINPGA